MTSPTIVTTHRGVYAILQAALPSRPLTNIGILLLDPANDKLYMRLRADLEKLAEPEDAEVLGLIEEDFEQKLEEMGGEVFLRFLEDTLSNVLRMTDRQNVMVRDFSRDLDKLFARHVQAAQVVPYVTHLPRYTLRAAAGRFKEDMEVEPEDWIEAPAGLRLSEDMFVAHISGRSMEPNIPNGSLCVFRARVAGTRQGKLLLIQNRGTSSTGGEFTIKRYRSTKSSTGDSWEHEKIRLEPLNPEFEAWELEPSQMDEGGPYQAVAEFVCVLEPDAEPQEGPSAS
jgi:phage repressor protein C with HTH and peptisase S24 domain